jgi:ribosomal protein S26
MFHRKIHSFVKSKTDVDPKIFIKLYTVAGLVGYKNMNLIYESTYRILSVDKMFIKEEYFTTCKILLVLDEIEDRIKRIGDVDIAVTQLNKLSQGLMSIDQFGKIQEVKQVKESITCVSCGNNIFYNKSIKKYNCENCFMEFSELC